METHQASISPDVYTTKKVLSGWTTKKVVSHLIAWEQMVILWVTRGMEGKVIPVPGEGFKRSELPALNDHIYQEHRDDSLVDVQKKFIDSFHHTMELLNSISEKDLITPGLYKWQNKNMLSAYFKSCTSSHYLWARKEIRKGLKG